jgi:hypothetical protein
MVGVALTNVAPGKAFGIAYVFFLLASVWSVGFWATSDFVASKRPSRGRRNTAAKSYHTWQWGGSACLVMLAVGAIGFTRDLQIENELRQLSGILIPADDPDSPCKTTDPQSLTVVAGGSAFATGKFPRSIIRIGCHDVLVLDRDAASNNIVVALKIFGLLSQKCD